MTMTCFDMMHFTKAFYCDGSKSLYGNEYSQFFRVKSLADKALFLVKFSDDKYPFITYQKNFKFDSNLSGDIKKANILGMKFVDNYLIEIYQNYKNGNLSEYMIKKKHLFNDDLFVLRFFLHILNAVAELHNRNIVHCNLRPNNIFIDDNGFPLLSDFNFVIGKNSKALFYSDINYASPELLGKGNQEVEWSFSNDVYSLGVILFTLFHERNPFNGYDNKQLEINILKGKFLFRKGLRQDIAELIRDCLERDPKKRISLIALQKKVKDVININKDIVFFKSYMMANIDDREMSSLTVNNKIWFIGLVLFSFILLILFSFFIFIFVSKRVLDKEEDQEVSINSSFY